jgi:hypothetical protein
MKFIAVAIKHLIAQGADPDAIQRFVDEISILGASTFPSTPKSDAERAKEYRARRKSGACMEEGSATIVTLCDASRDAVTLKEAPHTPPENKFIYTKRGGVPKKVAKELPEDWQPTENLFLYGRDLSLSRAEVLGVAEEMRIWAHSANGPHTKKKCWDLAFMGWMRRKAEQRKPKDSVTSFVSTGPKRTWREQKEDKEKKQ